jgi:hypothetical protein
MHTRFKSAGCYAILTCKQSPTLLGFLWPPPLRSPLPKTCLSNGCAAHSTNLEWQISTFILNRKDSLYPRKLLWLFLDEYCNGDPISSLLPVRLLASRKHLTLTVLTLYIYRAPCKARNFNVVYIYEPMFGNAESRLFLFVAQCLNTEWIMNAVLCHIYV